MDNKVQCINCLNLLDVPEHDYPKCFSQNPELNGKYQDKYELKICRGFDPKQNDKSKQIKEGMVNVYVTENIKPKYIEGTRKTIGDIHIVKVTHTQSGISVTAYGDYHFEAKQKAIDEIQDIVAVWEGW